MARRTPKWAALVLALAVGGAGCGDDGGSTGDPDGSGVNRDASRYCVSEVMLLACGRRCSPVRPCASGLHCGPENRCRAECVSGGDHCQSGFECDADGRCVSISNLDGGHDGEGG